MINKTCKCDDCKVWVKNAQNIRDAHNIWVVSLAPFNYRMKMQVKIELKMIEVFVELNLIRLWKELKMEHTKICKSCYRKANHLITRCYFCSYFGCRHRKILNTDNQEFIYCCLSCWLMKGISRYVTWGEE